MSRVQPANPSRGTRTSTRRKNPTDRPGSLAPASPGVRPQPANGGDTLRAALERRIQIRWGEPAQGVDWQLGEVGQGGESLPTERNGVRMGSGGLDRGQESVIQPKAGRLLQVAGMMARRAHPPTLPPRALIQPGQARCGEVQTVAWQVPGQHRIAVQQEPGGVALTKRKGHLGEPPVLGIIQCVSAKLDEPIFTPSTKAEEGHDENISFERMVEEVGLETATELRDRSIAIFKRGAEFALQRGIIIADTKFEFGRMDDGAIILIDEVLTPDSSRFWPADQYEPGRGQPSYDKQFVRDWLTASSWDKNSPPPELPEEIVAKTREKYIEAYEQLTGRDFVA